MTIYLIALILRLHIGINQYYAQHSDRFFIGSKIKRQIYVSFNSNQVDNILSFYGSIYIAIIPKLKTI